MNKKTEPVKSVLVIAIGFLIIYMYHHLRYDVQYNWILYVVVAVGLPSVFINKYAKLIDFLWMKLAWLLGQIVPNIILSAFYYLFLTPIALLSKIFGEKNQLDLKNKKESLFKEYKKTYEKTSFEKQW